MHRSPARALEALLWHPRLEAAPWPVRLAVRCARFAWCVLRDIVAGQLTLHAMGLVYVTILSLVPLLAVSLSVVKAFGFREQVGPLLARALEPLGARGIELMERVIAFVDNAQGNVLAGIGLVFLFFTAVSMAEQVETSINQIWRVERPRSLGRRISDYLAVILVGPVVMVTAMGLIASVRASAPAGLIEGMAGATDVEELLAPLAPYALVSIGFSLVYRFVPNTRVRRSAAIAGGVVGGVLWAGTGALFAAFVADSAMTLSIYATFAIVITALFWLYLCWLMLLVGAQVAFYAQNPDWMRVGYREPVTGTGHQEQAALAVMQAVAARFRAGRGATAVASITAATGVPGLALGPVIARLESAGLLARTSRDELLPGREPESILLREIVHAVRHPAVADVDPGVTWPEAVDALNRNLEKCVDAALGEATLASLLGTAGPGGGGR
jgi:membrane protein